MPVLLRFQLIEYYLDYADRMRGRKKEIDKNQVMQEIQEPMKEWDNHREAHFTAFSAEPRYCKL